MRLSRLDLDFFGHFTGKVLDFGPPPEGKADFHVLYGPNEAGKTTVMEGYLRLLYGFQPRGEPYAFRHDRTVLRVSGTLDIGGAATRFSRVPGRSGTLLDEGGAPLPETALAGVLAGLGQDDYRKLLCLDDETIEQGGNEIAASKGDIGRLLFAASAGIGDLSGVLETVQAEAQELYLKGGSKSAFAAVKRRLDEVTDAIRDGDVTAARYRRFYDDLAQAEEAVDTGRTTHRAAAEQLAGLKAIAGALPLLSEIAAAEAELAPLTAFPDRLDIDAEALADLLTRKTALDTERRGLAERRAQLAEARDAIVVDPVLAEMAPQVADLKEQRDRCATAAGDLPRRQEDLRQVTADMVRALREIGIDGGEAPERFVPDRPVLADLQRYVDAEAHTDAASRIAKDEARAAQAARGSAAQRRKQATDALAASPDLQAILDTFGADRLLERYNSARDTLRRAQKQADAALAALALGDRQFDGVPDLPLTAATATQIADTLAEQAAELGRQTGRVAEAATTQTRLAERLEAAESAAGPLADAAARAARSRRDALWSDHRAALTPDTAEAFEAAMQADDIVTDARQARAADLGELRALQSRLREARADHADRLTARDAAQAALDAARAQLAAHLVAAGWPDDVDPNAFAAWLTRAELARDAIAALTAERAAVSEDLDAAERLRTALSEILDAGDAPLDALMDLSRRRIKDRAELEGKARSAADAETEAERTLETRRGHADKTQKDHTDARSALDTAATDSMGALPAVPVADALQVLRDLREADVQRQDLTRQIRGMTRDADAFAEALAALCDLSDGTPAVVAYDAVAVRVAEAREAAKKRADLDSTLEKTAEKEREIAADVAGIDARLADLASAFDAAIPTDGPGDLRRAVAAGHRAIALRDNIARQTRDLCARLGVVSRTEAAQLLENQTPAAAAAALEEAEVGCSVAESERDQAIDARATAAAALAAVTGSADIATLTAERQTLELEMEALMLRHVELQLGHRLAETALRRYRDVHRSGMMQAADAAFRDLTNGAYSGLTTQVTGQGASRSEVLVAIHAADGAAKPVDTLSKGTRFQLYLALRAAAYDQMAASGTTLPFFCDDVFETFDEDRTRAACRLMRRIGQVGQAVYLTHHRHVVEIAEETCGGDVTVHRI